MSVIDPSLFLALTGRTVSQAALDAASDLVQSYCGWPIVESTRTIDLDSDGSSVLLLPGMNVTAVSSVTVNATDHNGDALPVPDWEFSSSGLLRAKHGRWWPRGFGAVSVEFTSGYKDIPGAVLLTVAALSDRLQLQAGVTQRLESVGGVSTNTSYGGMSGFMLGTTDLSSLAPFRLPSVA